MYTSEYNLLKIKHKIEFDNFWSWSSFLLMSWTFGHLTPWKLIAVSTGINGDTKRATWCRITIKGTKRILCKPRSSGFLTYTQKKTFFSFKFIGRPENRPTKSEFSTSFVLIGQTSSRRSHCIFVFGHSCGKVYLTQISEKIRKA